MRPLSAEKGVKFIKKKKKNTVKSIKNFALHIFQSPLANRTGVFAGPILGPEPYV